MVELRLSDPLTDQDAVASIVEKLWALGKSREEITREIVRERLVDLDVLASTLNDYNFNTSPTSSLESQSRGRWTFAELARTLIKVLGEQPKTDSF